MCTGPSALPSSSGPSSRGALATLTAPCIFSSTPAAPWLRCWFCGIDPDQVPITMHRDLTAWKEVMTRIFRELYRILAPGGHIAFEVGEVRGGKLKLEEAVLPCGMAAGLEPELILINQQQFTKTANCWGVDNNKKGTNSNRVVLFRKG